MTTIEKVIVVAALAVTYFVARYERVTKPSNYNDCILENMAGTPDHAVMDVRRACKALFPDGPVYGEPGEFDEPAKK